MAIDPLFFLPAGNFQLLPSATFFTEFNNSIYFVAYIPNEGQVFDVDKEMKQVRAMTQMDQLIEDIYKLFSGNQPGQYIDACTDCCMSPVDARRIKTIPLREIPLELMIEYQGAAKPAVLDLAELKYFAPRILEFIKDFQIPSFLPEVSLDRFSYFSDSDWTKEERQLLDAFALAFFGNYIAMPMQKDQLSLMEVLLMFYKGNFKINPLLQLWAACDQPASLLRFVQLLNSSEITRHGQFGIKNAFSEPIFETQFRTWLEAESTKAAFRQKIEQAIMEPSGEFTESELIELSWQYDGLV